MQTHESIEQAPREIVAFSESALANTQQETSHNLRSLATAAVIGFIALKSGVEHGHVNEVMHAKPEAPLLAASFGGITDKIRAYRKSDTAVEPPTDEMPTHEITEDSEEDLEHAPFEPVTSKEISYHRKMSDIDRAIIRLNSDIRNIVFVYGKGETIGEGPTRSDPAKQAKAVAAETKGHVDFGTKEHRERILGTRMHGPDRRAELSAANEFNRKRAEIERLTARKAVFNRRMRGLPAK